MEVVTHAARTLLQADGITSVLREGNLCYYAEKDAISPLWKGNRFPMSACISGWSMLERKAAVIPDIYVDPRIPHDAYRPTFVRSLAMVPVRQDDPIAAVGAYWSSTRQPTEAELELLQAIANAASLAIGKIRPEFEPSGDKKPAIAQALVQARNWARNAWAAGGRMRQSHSTSYRRDCGNSRHKLQLGDFAQALGRPISSR
jgi:GAF domain-containing protein